jgi:DNA-directed RNA polymerase subunit RPC12/RpoP
MARGEASVTCPQCGSYSRIPLMALRRDKYHCSRCGNHIPLSAVNSQEQDETRAPRSPSKRPFHKRKRR